MFFGDLLEKGQNALKWPENGPPEGGKPKTRFLATTPLLNPQKQPFLRFSSHMGAIIILGDFQKTPFFTPFWGVPKPLKNRRFQTFQVLKKIRSLRSVNDIKSFLLYKVSYNFVITLATRSKS